MSVSSKIFEGDTIEEATKRMQIFMVKNPNAKLVDVTYKTTSIIALFENVDYLTETI